MHICPLKKNISEIISQYKKKEIKGGEKSYKQAHRCLKQGMPRKDACMLSCKPGRKQSFKEHFPFILCLPFLTCFSLQPPSTGTSRVPSRELSSCSVPQVRPKKPRDAAVLQARGQCDPPGTGFLTFTIACPRPPPFQNISVSPSCILCQAEVSLTPEEGARSGATGRYCGCLRRKELLASEKTRHVRDAGRKGTDLQSGWIPDLLSDYALIP